MNYPDLLHRLVDQAEKRQTERMAQELQRTNPLDKDRSDAVESPNDREARLDHDEEGGAQFVSQG